MGTATKEPEVTVDPSVLEAHFRELLRDDADTIAAYLSRVGSHHKIEGTNALCHCYTIAVDANGKVGVHELISLMIESVTSYAIPRKQIKAAFAAAGGKNSRLLNNLKTEAKSLFTDLVKTGEGGELLLFVLAEAVLGLPQILCKMSLKSSSIHHYYGSDGVHATIDAGSGELLLWWGESKIYEDVTSAITECFKSLRPFLVEPNSPGAARDRDMLLLRDRADIADPELENALRCYFIKDKKESRRVRYCGIALVGFECEAYKCSPKAIQKKVDETVKQELVHWQKHIGKRLLAEEIGAFDLHVICVPFPSVDAFRRAFLKGLGMTPNEGAKSSPSSSVKSDDPGTGGHGAIT